MSYLLPTVCILVAPTGLHETQGPIGLGNIQTYKTVPALECVRDKGWGQRLLLICIIIALRSHSHRPGPHCAQHYTNRTKKTVPTPKRTCTRQVAPDGYR